LKILSERDSLNEIYWNRQKKTNPIAHSTSEKEKELHAGVSTSQKNG